MADRPRYAATIALVLVALGGAGLAVAADREQNAASRPEVTWAADREAQPWIEHLTTDLKTVARAASDLAKAGRGTLGDVQSLSFDAMRAAVDRGDAAAANFADTVDQLSADDATASAHIERWRLGSERAAQLEAIETAVAATANVPVAWTRVKARAATVYGLIDNLQRHDGLVFRGTTAGTQGNWADAISSIADAGTALGAARGIRDNLASGAATSDDTLDEVLTRYAEYDSALSALYEYLGSGGERSTAEFTTLNEAVTATQAALPADNGVFSLIVSEAAGTEITDALVELEQARGAINDALDAASGAPQ